MKIHDCALRIPETKTNDTVIRPLPFATKQQVSDLALALCHKIEEYGASEQLTELSILAANLRQEINKLPDFP